MNVQHTARTAEPLVPATKVHSPNTVLAQHAGAHDARLDGDVQVRVPEHAGGLVRQNGGEGHELGVAGAVEGAVRLVHATADDLAVIDEDAADGGFVVFKCMLGLVM